MELIKKHRDYCLITLDGHKAIISSVTGLNKTEDKVDELLNNADIWFEYKKSLKLKYKTLKGHKMDTYLVHSNIRNQSLDIVKSSKKKLHKYLERNIHSESEWVYAKSVEIQI